MEWSDALGILQDMSRGCLDNYGLEPLLRDFYASAVRPEAARKRKAQQTPTEPAGAGVRGRPCLGLG